MDERTLRSSHPWRGRRIAVRVDEVERSDGHRTTREIVEHPGAVGVLAWDGDRVALVRQWRHAAGAALLEIPAGTLEPGEAAAETARRELAEEAGLAAASWVAGPRFYTAPGFCTEVLQLYLATELSEAPAGGDEDESLEASWLSLDKALAAVGDGRIADAKSIVGLLWLARRLARD
jgi:ADP-ribose pyrophosphatase